MEMSKWSWVDLMRLLIIYEGHNAEIFAHARIKNIHDDTLLLIDEKGRARLRYGVQKVVALASLELYYPTGVCRWRWSD